MTRHKWSDVKHRRRSEAQIADIEQEVREELLEMNLRELRRHIGKTQEEIAAFMDSRQPQLSRVENGQEVLLSTLRRYVEALGGEIEINAVINDERIRLHGV